MSHAGRVFVGEDVDRSAVTVRLPDEAAHHVGRAIRARLGDTLTVFDGAGHEADAVIVSMTRDAVDVRIDDAGWRDGVGADASDVTWLQGVPKGDKLETIVKQATELGVAAIRPVFTERAIPRPGGATTRIERLRTIAISACEQSHRAAVSVIQPAASLEQALRDLDPRIALRLVAWEEGGEPFVRTVSLAAPGPCAVLVGPEGGLSAREVELALAHGFVAVSLGPRILRTETVAPALLAALSVLRGDLGHNGQ